MKKIKINILRGLFVNQNKNQTIRYKTKEPRMIKGFFCGLKIKIKEKTLKKLFIYNFK